MIRIERKYYPEEMMLQWKYSLVVLTAALALVHGRLLEEENERVRTDLVRLIPFDVQIAMTSPPENVNVYALTDIVTDWMTDSFTSKTENQPLIGNGTTFDSLGLELRSRRKLQEGPSTESIQLYTANYDGISLWERRGQTTSPTDPEIVELILRGTLVDDDQLLAMLRAAEPYTGLGDGVVDVRAYVASPAPAPTPESDNNLEIIIIIAIVVACLAFGLLMFAVIWAWRTDQNKRDSYKGDRSVPRIDVPTGSESEYNEKSPTGMTPPTAAAPELSPSPTERPPTEIASASPNDYPDSVISEDISTSLTAYYRSGVAGYSNTGGTRGSSGPRELNDAASMSSMDSYGYSLDGYAPSLGPAPQGYPVGPFNGMIKDPDSEYSEDEDTTFSTLDKDEQ